MTTPQVANRRSEQGFTLVELAIVMVIIGLLIGGILKGQELIGNAKVSASVSQLKALDAALNTFQDKYNALPGDMLTPNTRLPGCTGTPCSNPGDGNGRIGANTTTVPTNTDELGVSFAHLSAADLISGINTSTNTPATFGNLLPALKAGGGFWIAYNAAAPNGTNISVGRHYAVITGSTNSPPAAATGVLSAISVAQIDRKIDDGVPLAGAFQGYGSNCLTGAGAAATYNEASTTGTCSAYARVLN